MRGIGCAVPEAPSGRLPVAPAVAPVVPAVPPVVPVAPGRAIAVTSPWPATPTAAPPIAPGETALAHNLARRADRRHRLADRRKPFGDPLALRPGRLHNGFLAGRAGRG